MALTNYLFLDFVTGFPGSIHDSRALRASELFRKCEANEYLIAPESIVENVRIIPLILGDGPYPASDWRLIRFNKICAEKRENITEFCPRVEALLNVLLAY